MDADCAILGRGYIIMENRPSNSNTDGNPVGENNSPPQQRRTNLFNLISGFIQSGMAALIALASILVMIGGMNSDIKNLQDDIDKLEKNVNSKVEKLETDIKGSIEELKRTTAESDTLLSGRINGLWRHILEEEGNDSALVDMLLMENDFQKIVVQTYGVVDQYSTISATLEPTSYILHSAYDEEIKYTVKEVAEKKLLLPYMENGQQCFFYGQLDEKGNWDGDCIVNIYRDGKLELLTEATYEAGILKTFQQAFPSKLRNGQSVWYFSKRTMEQGFSSGETWDYFSAVDFQQEFEYEEVTTENILDIDSLQLKVCGALEGYYNGNASNGRFNDNSGKAYMVKYFEDGTVRMLYEGNFKNGFPEDSSNNSWMIGRLSMDEAYSYYKGPFEDGSAAVDPNAQNAKDYWDIDISQEDIDRLLEGRTFDCELTWSIPRA